MNESELLSAEARILEAEMILSETRKLRSRIKILEMVRRDKLTRGQDDLANELGVEIIKCQNRLTEIE